MASPSDLMVIVGASGLQGSHLIPLLHGKYKLRLISSKEPRAAALREKYPEAEVVVGDLTVPDDCKRAVKDAHSIFHLGPSMHPRERAIGFNMIDAAVHEDRHGSGHIEHFVYSSVHSPQLSKLLNHDCKRFVEERLIESPLNYTILQPTQLLNMAVPVRMIAAQGPPIVWNTHYGLYARVSFIALEDYAAVAARVLTERQQHFGAQYALASTEQTTFTDVARVMSDVMGKTVRVRQMEVHEGTDVLLKRLYGDTGRDVELQRDAIERLILYYNRRMLRGNNNVCRWLLGREPTSLRQYIEKEFEGASMAWGMG